MRARYPLGERIECFIMPAGRHLPPGELDRAMAAVILEEMNRQSITAKDLAVPIGISRSQLSRVLAGKLSFTLGEFERACNALGVAEEDMVVRAKAAKRRHLEASNNH